MLCGGLRWGNSPHGPLAVEIGFESNSRPNFCANWSLRALFEVMMVLLCGPLGGVEGLPEALSGGHVHFWMAGLCHLGSIGTPCVSKSPLICKKRVPSET